MLHSVSWQQLITALVVILFLYYLVVIIMYYRKDLAKLSRPRTYEKPTLPATMNVEGAMDANALLFSTVHELMEELKRVFYTAAKNDYPKEELMMALQVKLRDYPKLKGTPFQVSINNHMEQESKNTCQTELTEQDIRNLW